MAMNAIDYQTKLADKKTHYEEHLNHLRDSYRKNLQHKDDVHAQVKKNQRETFLKQRNQLERTQAKNLENYNRKTGQKIEDLTKRYKDHLETQKENHIRDHKNFMELYNNRLARLSESYQNNNEENANRLEALKERYAQNSRESQEDFNRKVDHLNKVSADRNKNLQDSHDVEKKATLKRHLQEKNKLVKDAKSERDEMQTTHRLEKEDQRKTYRRQAALEQERRNEIRENLLESHLTQRDQQRRTFKNLMGQLSKQAKEDLHNLGREKKLREHELKKEFSHKVTDLKRKAERLAALGRLKEKGGNDQVEARWEQRLANLRHSMEELDFKHRENSERVLKDQQEAVRLLGKDYNRKINQEREDNRYFREHELSKVQRDFANRERQQLKRQRYLETESENERLAAAQKARRVLNNTKSEHYHLVNRINKVHDRTIQGLKKDLLEEQSKVIEESKRRNSLDLLNLREDLTAQRIKKEQRLNKIIEDQKQENINLVDKYKNKLVRTKKKAVDEIRESRILESERRYEDQVAVQRELKRRDAANLRERGHLRAELERKLRGSQAEMERSMERVVNNYEDLLRGERREFQKTLRRRLNLLKRKNQDLARYAENQQEALIQKYETKIEDIKEAYGAAQKQKLA